jgi:Helix-turn-helix domain of resolvase
MDLPRLMGNHTSLFPLTLLWTVPSFVSKNDRFMRHPPVPVNQVILSNVRNFAAAIGKPILRERVKAGIAQARKPGTPHGRPPTVAHQAAAVRQLAADGLSKSAIARQLGLSRTSVRRFMG